MNLTVRINGIEYKNCVAQGITFSEEFNETLDSCVVRISNVPRITGIEPYDDVYIYDTDNFNFDNDVPILRTTDWGQYPNGRTFSNGQVWTEALAGQYSDNPFYRHFLLDQFTETIVRLGATREDNICDYTLELFSETKRLEKVQLPNLSITQPLNARKRKSVWEYLNIYLGLYSPKIKVVDDAQAQTWKYAPKYTLSASLQETFGDIYCPEFTLSNPTLRDIFSQLMIVADCIPYVRDDIIYSMDISKRGATFSITDEMANGRVNYITSSKTSDDYCDGVRRQYSQALAKNGTCRYVENLGFRNANVAIMSLENIELETTNPIYKINRVYMCYYKLVDYYNGNDQTTTINKPILIKQDITKLVKLSSEWSVLSQDWQELGANPPTSVNELSKYKIATVQYSQGGNRIIGWGTTYSLLPTTTPLVTYVLTRSYLENIFNYIDSWYPFGIYTMRDYVNKLEGGEGSEYSYIITKTPTPDASGYRDFAQFIATNIGGATSVTKLKTLFFEIDYDAFYNGAIVHSRDNGRDRIIANDNSSSSLALLEKDGVNQKEKLNRFANKTYQIQGKLRSIDNLIGLSQTTTLGEDDDVIVYKREYSIYDNDIAVNYLAIQNYVLRDYFVSVYSKYRTYQLMSYGESVNRAETLKQFYVLSANSAYKDSDDTIFGDGVLSAFVETPNFQNVDGPAITPIVGSIYLGNKMGAFAVNDEIGSIRINTSADNYNNWYAFVSGLDFSQPTSPILRAVVNGNTVNVLQVIRDQANGTYTISARVSGQQRNIVIIDTQTEETDFVIGTSVVDLNNTYTLTDVNMPSGWDSLLLGEDIERGEYGTDINIFTSGNMLCVNIRMRDNISGGNYIKNWLSNYNILLAYPSDDADYIRGTLQDWYDISDDNETGEIKALEYRVYTKEMLDVTDTTNAFQLLSDLPKYENGEGNDFLIKVAETPYLDNKDLLDKTFCVELYSADKNIVVSPWFMLLNSTLQEYYKFFSDKTFEFGEMTIGSTPVQADISGTPTELGAEIRLGIYYGTASTELNVVERLPFGVTYNTNYNVQYTWNSLFNGTCTFSFNATSLKKEYSTNYNADIITLYGEGKLTRQSGTPSEIDYQQLEFVKSTNFEYYFWQSLSGESYGAIYGTSGLTIYGEYFNVKRQQNCFLRVVDKTDTTVVYQEHKCSSWASDKNNTTNAFEETLVDYVGISVGSVFTVDANSNTITINLSEFGDISALQGKSIEYWYLDDAGAYEKTYAVGEAYTYDPIASAYHFVFGINIPENQTSSTITVFVSKLFNRDKSVFLTETGEVEGEINNCIVNGQYQDLGYTYTPVAQNQ